MTVLPLPSAPKELDDEKEHRRRLAERANACLPLNGSQRMRGPLMLAQYTVDGAPPASDYEGGEIYVTDEIGGPTRAWSNGTNWLRTSDDTPISA